MSENTTEIIYRLEHDKRRLSTELDDLQHDIGVFIECGTHLDKDDAESLRTEDGIELYNVLHDVQQKHYETLTALAAEESDKILYRNQRDDLAQAKEWSDLVIENNRLRADLAAVSAERDRYRMALGRIIARRNLELIDENSLTVQAYALANEECAAIADDALEGGE